MSEGLSLLREGLRGSRRPLWRIAAWSGLEAAPALAAGGVTAAALDRGFLADRPGVGVAWLGGLLLLFVVRAAAERAMFPHLAEVVEPLRDRLTRRLVAATLQRATLRDRSSDAVDAAGVARLTRQVESVRNLTGTLVRTARPLVLTFLATAAGLFALTGLTALLVLPPFLVALCAYALALRLMIRRRRALLLAEERVATGAGDGLLAARDIAALGAVDHAVSEVEEQGRAYARASVAAAWASAPRPLLVLLGGYGPILILLLVGPGLVDRGRLTTGELVGAVTAVAGYLLPALQLLTGMVGGLWAQLSVTLTRLAETSAQPAPARTGGPPPAGYDVRAESLTFAYGPHAEPVLRELDLDIDEGDHLAIVGASGIGKSTLANLLAGWESPGGGCVLLGGVPMSMVDDAARCHAVAVVPQEAYVFAGTVRDNLRYLNPDASTTELRDAVERVGAARLVERLGGLDATVDDPRAELSSGERQLLVLVRVYVARARVVILDEATCHLDPVAEVRAERAFAERPGTLIVIAHRIASARRARRILLLDGPHTAIGTHDELLATSPRYADLAGRWHPADQPVAV